MWSQEYLFIFGEWSHIRTLLSRKGPDTNSQQIVILSLELWTCSRLLLEMDLPQALALVISPCLKFSFVLTSECRYRGYGAGGVCDGMAVYTGTTSQYASFSFSLVSILICLYFLIDGHDRFPMVLASHASPGEGFCINYSRVIFLIYACWQRPFHSVPRRQALRVCI